MANAHVPKPKMKEKNPGYDQSRSGVKVKTKGNPLGAKVIPTNPTKKGGIFRATKSN